MGPETTKEDSSLQRCYHTDTDGGKQGVLVVGVIDRILTPAASECKVIVLRCADESLPVARDIRQRQLTVLASVRHDAADDAVQTIIDVQSWCEGHTVGDNEMVPRFIQVYVWQSTSVAKTDAAVRRGGPRYRALEDDAPVTTNIGSPLEEGSLVLCRVRLTRRDFPTSDLCSSRPRYRGVYIMGASHVMRIYRTSFSPS